MERSTRMQVICLKQLLAFTMNFNNLDKLLNTLNVQFQFKYLFMVKFINKQEKPIGDLQLLTCKWKINKMQLLVTSNLLPFIRNYMEILIKMQLNCLTTLEIQLKISMEMKKQLSILKRLLKFKQLYQVKKMKMLESNYKIQLHLIKKYKITKKHQNIMKDLLVCIRACLNMK